MNKISADIAHAKLWKYIVNNNNNDNKPVLDEAAAFVLIQNHFIDLRHPPNQPKNCHFFLVLGGRRPEPFDYKMALPRPAKVVLSLF